MNDIKVYKLNETYFTLDTPTEECDKELYAYFSCVIPGMKYAKKNKAWNGKISFYDAKKRIIPIGLFPLLKEFCKTYSYNVHLLFNKEEFKGTFDESYLEAFLVDIFKNHKKKDYKLRYYQKDSVEISLKRKRGIIRAGTSAGKTAIIYSLVRYFHEKNKRILVIVPGQNLVEQIYENFKDEYGWSEIDSCCSRMYSGILPNLRHTILISTYQTLAKQQSNFFESFDCVLVDEAQTAQNNSIADNILRKCCMAEYRIGFTGTLPRGKYELFRIQGYLGSVIYSISTEELQKNNFANKCKVASLILKYNENDVKTLWDTAQQYQDSLKLGWHDEIKFLNSHEKRNNSLKFVFSKIKDRQNTLLLVNEIIHLESVKDFIEKNLDKKYKIYVITGEVEAEEREKIRILMETEGNVILLATYGTMAVGISITNLEHIVLFRSFRSEIRVLQSIGRGLRLMEGKSTTIIWDIVDYLPYKHIGEFGEVVFYNHCFNQWNKYDVNKTNYGMDSDIKLGRMDYYIENKFETAQILKNVDEL